MATPFGKNDVLERVFIVKGLLETVLQNYKCSIIFTLSVIWTGGVYEI